MKINLSKWQTKVWLDDHRFKVINIGRRAGKTLLSIVRMIHEAGLRKQIVWYISPTYKQSKLIAWSMLKENIPSAMKPIYNETELKVTLVNGSEIWLKGADNPDSLRGTKIDFAIFDEVAFFMSWQQVWEALRPILVDSKASCWFISTPRGFNHFYDMFYQQDYDPDYKSFHFTSYDNPYIDRDEIEKTKKEMTDRSFAQEFLAEFNKPAGTVYEEWPLENFKEVPYDINLPVHISMDFGINDPTSLIWLQNTGSEYRVIDYYEASNANLDHFISVIRAKPYKEAELYTGDYAGNARTLTTGTSPIEILARAGIHVRTKSGVKIADQIRLTHQIIPSLYVDLKAERFRDCLLNYRYPDLDTEKRSKLNKENEIPIHDQYSHAMRALEYYCVNVKDVGTQPIFIPPMTGFGGERIEGMSL
jgi:phage terminase large subunit